MKAIFTMEKEYRVPILSELTKKQSEFQEEIWGVSSKRKSGIVSSIAQWLKSSGYKKEPTWQNLFHILRCIDLSPLAWQLVDCILRAMIGRYTCVPAIITCDVIMHIDTAKTLENELIRCNSVMLGEEDILRQKIESFVNQSNITISILKRKYDELRIDFDELLRNSPGAEFEIMEVDTTKTSGL